MGVNHKHQKLVFGIFSVMLFFAYFQCLQLRASTGSDLEIGMKNETYLGGGRRAGNLPNQYPYFNASADLYFKSAVLESSLRIRSGFTVNQSDFQYLDFPEAYVGTSSELLSPFKFSFGRKLEQWNHLDDFWDQGYFQPRTRFDYLDPEPVGLLGLFSHYDLQLGDVPADILVFGSFINLPEQRACSVDVDGKFESQSPWCVPVQKSFTFNQSENPIFYRVETPPISDLVTHPSFGSKIHVGGKSGPWGQLAFQHKPMNQFLIGLDGIYVLDSNRLEVTFHPRIVYHQIVGADVGYQGEVAGVTLSGFYENPLRDNPSKDWTTEEITRSGGVSPQVHWRADNFFGRPSHFSAGYLRQWGGPTADQGLLASGPGSFFELRMMYREALRADWDIDLLSHQGRHFFLGLGFLRDLEIQGSHLHGELRYHPNETWKVFLGSDILGAQQTDAAILKSGEPNFLNRYKANDRVYGGVAYVF